MHLNEGFLGRILSFIRILQDLQDNAIDPVAICIHQPSESRLTAFLQLSYELNFIQIFPLLRCIRLLFPSPRSK